MLFLPAAALCCLCSALVAMAAELVQKDLTLTRRVGETVSFSCERTDQCDETWLCGSRPDSAVQLAGVQLYRADSDTDLSDETKGGGVCFSINSGWCNDVTEIQQLCSLDLEDLLTHWKPFYSPYKYYGIFGSGTKLYVTDEQVVKPVVSVYPAASRAHLEGKSSLLCVASDMFPPLVRFSWKRRKVNESLEEPAPAEEEQLELRESGRSAAIRVIDRDALYTYKYRCYVQHEGGRVKAQTEQELPVASCPPEREPADLAALQQADLSFQSPCRVKLLCLLYTVLIVKSLVYCCGLSLLRILRNK